MNIKKFEIIKDILNKLHLDMSSKRALKVASNLSKINL